MSDGRTAVAAAVAGDESATVGGSGPLGAASGEGSATVAVSQLSGPSAVAGTPGRSLRQRAARGAAWSFASVMLLRFGNIAIMAVVARLVAPAEFGVFALAITVHTMVLTLAELGVSSAIARADLELDRIAPTVTTIALVTSLAAAGAMVAAAGPLADFMGSAEAAGPLRVLALSVALIGPFAVPGAQLQREFRQDRLFTSSLAAFVVSSAVLLVLAVAGLGAYSFAWSRVAERLVAGAVMVASVTQRYRPGLRRGVVRPLLRFGLPLAGANLLSQILLNVDYAFVGRMLGTAAVGVYLLAFNIASWPTSVLGSMLNSVVLPAFSTVKQDRTELVAAVTRVTRSVALVACPIGFLTMVLAKPLVVTVYGPKWASAAPVLSVLSLYGVIFVVCLLFANVIIAMGRTGSLLAVQVAALAVLLPALLVAIRAMGLVGAGVAHIAVIASVTLPVYLLAVRRSTGTGPQRLGGAVAWPVVAGGVAALVAWAVSAALGAPVWQLLVGGTAGVVTYTVLTAPMLVRLLPERLTANQVARRIAAAGDAISVRFVPRAAARE